MAHLTEKQRRFVEAYMGEAKGNATEAARLAGYKGNDQTLSTVGTENIRKPAIMEAIQERVNADPLVLSREELQRWWTEVVRDDDEEMKNRLRASELLGKSRGEFITTLDTKKDSPLGIAIANAMDLAAEITDVDAARKRLEAARKGVSTSWDQ